VQTLVFGWSELPEAALNDLAEIASDLGVAITAQGLDERTNKAAVTLFETLSQESLRWFQQRVPLDVAVLRQFTAVEILDSTCIALPATLKQTYPGSGGDAGGCAVGGSAGGAAGAELVCADGRRGPARDLVSRAGVSREWSASVCAPKGMRTCPLYPVAMVLPSQESPGALRE
jgi:hypothetical protein